MSAAYPCLGRAAWLFLLIKSGLPVEWQEEYDGKAISAVRRLSGGIFCDEHARQPAFLLRCMRRIDAALAECPQYIGAAFTPAAQGIPERKTKT